MPKKALVASHNLIKAYATEDALGTFCGEYYRVDLAPNKIESGVKEQPMSLAETANGALFRLAQIRKLTGYAFYIAIEGGAYSVKLENGQELWYESACAAVSDDSPKSSASIAYGPAYPIPPEIAAHLIRGMDLNEAMELEIGVAKIGNAGGFNGWLTEGRLDRQAGSTQAVLLALYGLKYRDNQHD